MKSQPFWAAGLIAAAGLAVFDAAASADDAQAPGVVRITDSVRPVAGFFPASDSQPAAEPAHPAASPVYAAPHATYPGGYAAGTTGVWPGGAHGWHAGKDCPPGDVIWEGHPHTLTGIPPIDWATTAGLKTKGHVAAGWHKFWWCVLHRHKKSGPECPPEQIHGGFGGYHCPPHMCHPLKCGPRGCGPHCGVLKHGWAHPAPAPEKFGYLQPAGIESHGHYSAAYPVNPWHFDQRDGRIYAAEGWGVPMAVPIAPNVEHTYNYGWGIPSSRLTPLSHMPPDSRALPRP